jgi:kynurenine formamidase
MTQLADLLASFEVVDLTQPLSEDTPVLRLPEPFVNTPGLSRRELSRYDERGPAWAWDVLEIGEHVGTHFDAPIHWITGRDGQDVASVPPSRLVGPAVVLDFSAEAAEDNDWVLTVDHVRAFEANNGPIPEGAWLLLRTGWDARAHDEEAFLNADEDGPHTPGIDVRLRALAGRGGAGGRRRGRDRRHRRGRRGRLRPAVPRALVPARGGQVRPHPAGEPRAAAADRGDRDRRAAEARARDGEPGARAGARAALTTLWQAPVASRVAPPP